MTDALEAAAKQSLWNYISAGSAAPALRAAPLPLGGSEDGTDVMMVLLLLSNVVGEVCCVPDYHVPVANVLPIDESVKIGSEGRSNGNGTVVDLSLVKPQYPHVATPAVIRARDQVVGIVSLHVPDLPPSALLGPAAPLSLKLEGVPVISGEDGRGVELADRVVLCGT